MKLTYGQHANSTSGASGASDASASATNGSVEAPTVNGLQRFTHILGAVVATAFALWFLFGIPAYLLFGEFFD